jgi:hypothetical protein
MGTRKNLTIQISHIKQERIPVKEKKKKQKQKQASLKE